eukprot:CAMPEP_0175092946 /NCGR_PEP_ID=MMETSP0086_2-20121207/2733_1 /TAXON_ID=136419 /ORGANISM="Unknown Unknown, Strain D1" /LENGTH=335 /DNA_ID=CAMNT_0016365841 /DNA_START=63 /DNA_END=1070 /DNA_ORIENTATION=-
MRSNKICAATWDKYTMNSHKQRLGSIKATIDTKSPKVYPHLINRAKKEQMLEERYTQIEHENRILLKKMSRIMRTTSMDNLNLVKPKSLNSVVRKNELRRIMAENQKILTRIQGRKPYYDRREWDKHEVNHSKFLDNLRDKPVKTLPLLNDKYANAGRSHSAGAKRLLLAPIEDEEGKENVHVIKGAKKKSAAPKPSPIRAGRAAKGKGASPKKKDRVEISKGGRSIDGQYVIVTVDEVFKPEHGLEFKSYDLDTSEHHETLVLFSTIETLVPDDLLKPEKREELSNTLMERLKFNGADLVFDSEAAAVAAADELEKNIPAADDAEQSYGESFEN